jgi:hypothetical protein
MLSDRFVVKLDLNQLFGNVDVRVSTRNSKDENENFQSR